MVWSLILDLVVSVLLVVTIGYAIVLNRRLTSLRRQRAELETGTAAFEQAIRSAEDGIGRLRIGSDGLKASVEKATAVQNDLAFLVERAEGLADRLEQGVRAGRTAPARAAAGAAASVHDLKGRQDTAGPKSKRDAAGPAAKAPAAGQPGGARQSRGTREPRSETERALMRALGGGQ